MHVSNNNQLSGFETAMTSKWDYIAPWTLFNRQQQKQKQKKTKKEEDKKQATQGRRTHRIRDPDPRVDLK